MFLLVGMTIVAGVVLSVASASDLEAAGGGTGMFSECFVDECALKAAAMAMAPLMPVPATRQITVE